MNLLLLALQNIEEDKNEINSKNQELDDAIYNLAKGKLEYMEIIYNESKSAVYGYILSILKNKHESEDVLQDTYVKIYTSADMYKSQGKPLAWIFTIARNLAFMKIRNSKKVVNLNETYDDIALVSEKLDVGDKMLIRAMMKELSSEEVQIIMMYVVAGFKQVEIADFMSLPLSTVTSKYNRAIVKLRAKIEGDFYE